MRPASLVAFLASALFATGCMTSSHEHGTRLPEPEGVPVGCTYTHAPSGLEFPEEVGPFRRMGVLRYDAEERDVSAAYEPRAALSPFFATVYVYPGRQVSSFLAYGRTVTEYEQRLAKQDFKAERDDVLNHYEKDQNAAMVSEGEVMLSLGGAERRGWRAEFSVEGAMGVPGMHCTSLLYWFPSVGGKWNVKYRFTYVRGPSSPDKGIQTILEGAPWPEPAH